MKLISITYIIEKGENCILPCMQDKCFKYPIHFSLRDVDSFVLFDDVHISILGIKPMPIYQCNMII